MQDQKTRESESHRAASRSTRGTPSTNSFVMKISVCVAQAPKTLPVQGTFKSPFTLGLGCAKAAPRPGHQQCYMHPAYSAKAQHIACCSHCRTARDMLGEQDQTNSLARARVDRSKARTLRAMAPSVKSSQAPRVVRGDTQ